MVYCDNGDDKVDVNKNNGDSDNDDDDDNADDDPHILLILMFCRIRKWLRGPKSQRVPS